jgi:hypothetical protein
MLLLLSLAQAADLHTCKATATGPDGHSMTLRGFGATAAEAKRAARQSARFLADQHVLVAATRGWYGNDPGALDDLAASVRTKGTEGFAVPGWTLTAGECTTEGVEDGALHTTRWTEGGPEVTRTHPADAREAARRRGCVGPYQIAFMQTLKKAVGSEPSARPGAMQPLTAALSKLQTCWAGPPSKLTPSGEASAVEGNTAQCTAIDHRGGRLAVGYGADPERAAEDALRQSLLVRTRDLIGDLGHAADRIRATEGDEAAQAKMVQILERVAGLTGASDAIDRSRLACNLVTPGPLTWKPEGVDARACNAMSWTERPTTPVTLSDAGAFLDTTCALQVDPTMAIVRFSLPKEAGPKREQIIASAMMIGGRCEATCLGSSTWGTVGKPVVLRDAPDRTSKNAVIQAVRALDTDPMAGMGVLPTLQDPDALKGLFDGTLVPALQKDVYRLPADRWKRLDQHWILTVP